MNAPTSSYSAVESFIPRPHCVILEKQSITPDADIALLEEKARELCGQKIKLIKSILIEVCGNGKDLDRAHLIQTKLLFNTDKEVLLERHHSPEKYGILLEESSLSQKLESDLREKLKENVSVHILECWDFGDTDDTLVESLIDKDIFNLSDEAILVRI